MNVGPQIAMLAAASALVLGWAGASALSAQAATGVKIANNYYSSELITSAGSSKPVTLSIAGSEYEATDLGGSIYQFEAGSDLCLQDDVAGTAVTEGGCESGQTRQEWYWDSAHGILENIWAADNGLSRFAYATGALSVGMTSSCALDEPLTADSPCQWRFS